MLNMRGIPQSGLLSISAGGMRKQVQVANVDRPLRFPAVDDMSQIKVDVLGLRGRARLPYEAFEEKTCTLAVEPIAGEPAPADGMEVDLVVRPCAPETPLASTEELDARKKLRKEMDANGYLEEHGLLAFVQFLLHSLMQDKPADPYPFLMKQVNMKMAKQGEKSVPTSPAGNGFTLNSGQTLPALDITSIPVIPDTPGYSTVPLTPVPPVQDLENDISGLLERTTRQASKATSAADIASLEQQALEASQRLRADNAKLRETAEQMRLEYEALMQESSDLHNKLNAKRKAKQEAAMAEAASTQTRAQAAYVEIEKLQDEVGQLARENAKLVADLSRGREMIDSVRLEMVDIRRTIGE